MATWFETVARRMETWGELDVAGGGMSMTSATMIVALLGLTWVLRREVERRQRRVAPRPPVVPLPAPTPKIVLKLPRRSLRA